MSYFRRLLLTEIRSHYNRNLRRPLYLWSLVVQPLVMATVMVLLARAVPGADASVLLARRVVVGAGLMGLWSSLLFSSGSDLSRERQGGGLAFLLASPTPLWATVLARALINAATGFLSFVLVWAYAAWVFRVPLDLPHPALTLLALSVVAYTFVGLGLVLATWFGVSRQAGAYQNLLEYPLVLVCGLMVPLEALPRWVDWLAAPLPPTWAVRALSAALEAGPVWPRLGWALLWLGVTGSACYLASGVLFRWLERLALRHGTVWEG